MVICSTYSIHLIHYLLHRGSNNILFLSAVFLYFRDRALFARLAFLHDHGGQFSDGGRAATDARGGCSVSQLAGLGWLAGPADCHNLPFRSDAALRLVSPTLRGFHSRRGDHLLLLSQAMACTVHTALHRTEHNLLLLTNNALFLLSFVFFPPSVSSSCFHNTFWFCPTIPILSTSFPSLSLQDFSWVVALVAGHPALQTIQSHDAAHHQQEPGWHDNWTKWSSYRWKGFQEGCSAKMKDTKSILL